MALADARPVPIRATLFRTYFGIFKNDGKLIPGATITATRVITDVTDAAANGTPTEIGTTGILWLVIIVVVSDVAGYFVGRIMGGPKFWPKVSPKKTWSGTVAGWIGAALVGLCFVLAGRGDWGLLILSPIVALAGQLGDILESWVKRRVGVKDSSNLIPGHGGLLDRFDALIGATVLVMLLGLFLKDLPIG
jgi:phosphatidate cytidylyltransferase